MWVAIAAPILLSLPFLPALQRAGEPVPARRAVAALDELALAA
jgi:hypothetical protein